MAAKAKKVPWFKSFNAEEEVLYLLDHIERCTEFELPARKRAVIMSFAKAEIDKIRQGYPKSRAPDIWAGTSRAGFLADLQDMIFMGIPEENLARMPVSEMVLDDPSVYLSAVRRAASISEDELFMVLSSSLKDMTVQDAQAFVSKLWHGTIDDNARRYAEALKRSEREPYPL